MTQLNVNENLFELGSFCYKLESANDKFNKNIQQFFWIKLFCVESCQFIL